MSLPLCDLTELPRVLCDHCDSFTMSDAERAYLAGEAPADTRPDPLDAPRAVSGRPVALPEYGGSPWTEPRDVKIADSPVLCQVPDCSKPSGEQSFVCAHCLDDLEVALSDIPELAEDLMVLMTKGARFTAAASGSDRSPLPYVPAAGAMLTSLNAAVASLVRCLCAHRHLTPPPSDAVVGSRWLLEHLHDVGQDQDAPPLLRLLVAETRRARRTIDRPAEKAYIGVCDRCRVAMHADLDRADHLCTTCGERYDVPARRESITARVLESLLSLREIADLSGLHLGRRVSLKQLEGWVRRDRLIRAGSKPHPYRPGDEQALYRAGDVLALLEERKSA